jgi:hypothetical protein
LIWCLTAAASLLLAGQAAQAQIPGSGPGMSPWFNLFNKNPGPLGNYNSYVLPQFQVQNAFQQQSNSILQQGAAIQQGNSRLNLLGNQVNKLQRGEGMLPPTGHAATFMNYSHYYGHQAPGAGTGMPQRTMPTRGTAGGATSMPGRGMAGATSMPGMPGGVQ